MKKVSIILTTYNSKSNLEYTLRSIEEQDYSNIEVIIKDGASTDGTLEEIIRYEEKSKHQVKWISEKDAGIYDAMNKGYNISSGDIIVFFNDIFASATAVYDMVTLIDSNPNCIGAHADLEYVDGELIKQYILSNNPAHKKIIRKWKMGDQRDIRLGWMPGHPTLFLKREVYEKYGLYRTDLKIAADYEFMIRILKENNNQLMYFPNTIVYMYYGGTSSAGATGYLTSLKEGHRALVENGIKNAFIVDIMRMFRVVKQFRNK